MGARPQVAALVLELADRHGLAGVADAIIATLSPALQLRKLPERARDRRSKLGGTPLVPDGAEWPHRATQPLTALAQIDCEEIAAVAPELGLPARGLLQLFYDVEEQPWGFDPADAGGAVVRYLPDPDRCRTPATTPVVDVPPRALGFHRIMTLPSLGSLAGDALALTYEQRLAYIDLCSDFVVASLDEQPGHQLGGHPDQVQGDMQLECQLVTNGLYCGDASGYESPRARELAPGAADWTLLLQIDSDDELGLMWGDLGRVYFWIRRQDLAARDFSRVWAILQCG